MIIRLTVFQDMRAFRPSGNRISTGKTVRHFRWINQGFEVLIELEPVLGSEIQRPR